MFRHIVLDRKQVGHVAVDNDASQETCPKVVEQAYATVMRPLPQPAVFGRFIRPGKKEGR